MWLAKKKQSGAENPFSNRDRMEFEPPDKQVGTSVSSQQPTYAGVAARRLTKGRAPATSPLPTPTSSSMPARKKAKRTTLVQWKETTFSNGGGGFRMTTTRRKTFEMKDEPARHQQQQQQQQQQARARPRRSNGTPARSKPALTANKDNTADTRPLDPAPGQCRCPPKAHMKKQQPKKKEQQQQEPMKNQASSSSSSTKPHRRLKHFHDKSVSARLWTPCNNDMARVPRDEWDPRLERATRAMPAAVCVFGSSKRAPPISLGTTPLWEQIRDKGHKQTAPGRLYDLNKQDASANDNDDQKDDDDERGQRIRVDVYRLNLDKDSRNDIHLFAAAVADVYNKCIKALPAVLQELDRINAPAKEHNHKLREENKQRRAENRQREKEGKPLLPLHNNDAFLPLQRLQVKDFTRAPHDVLSGYGMTGPGLMRVPRDLLRDSGVRYLIKARRAHEAKVRAARRKIAQLRSADTPDRRLIKKLERTMKAEFKERLPTNRFRSFAVSTRAWRRVSGAYSNICFAKLQPSNPSLPSTLQHDAVIKIDRHRGLVDLHVRFDAPLMDKGRAPDPRFDSVCAVDPGVRTLATAYTTNRGEIIEFAPDAIGDLHVMCRRAAKLHAKQFPQKRLVMCACECVCL